MTNAVHEMTEDQSAPVGHADIGQLCTRVHELATDINKNTFDLGKVLWEIKGQAGRLRSLGYASLEELGERAGIGARKMHYLIEIHEWFVVRNRLPDVLDARLRRLPWTKLRHLVGVATAGNAAEWIATAESLTRDELTQKVKAHKNTPQPVGQSAGSEASESTPEIFVRRPFVLADTANHEGGTQASVVDTALKRAAKLSGSNKDGHNLALICTDFLATNDFPTLSGEAKLHYLAKIETLLGLKLIVANPDCSQVLYGLATLLRLADAIASVPEESEDVTNKGAGQSESWLKPTMQPCSLEQDDHQAVLPRSWAGVDGGR